MSEWAPERIAEYRAMTQLDDVRSMLDEIERLQQVVATLARTLHQLSLERRHDTGAIDSYRAERDAAVERNKLFEKLLRDVAEWLADSPSSEDNDRAAFIRTELDRPTNKRALR